MTWTERKAALLDQRTAGFSLIEMLVVLGLIAMMAVVVVPSVSGYFRVSLNSATRDLATTVKESYDAALLTGRVYRIVYDFKGRQYWSEAGTKDQLMQTAASKEKEERRKRFASSEKEKPSSFALDKTVTPRKVTLPMGVSFDDIVPQSNGDPITEGTAYTHFFPSGLTEQALIHLKDESAHRISLVITPLLGKTDLYDRYITKDEAFASPR